jgi:hypothetical protein
MKEGGIPCIRMYVHFLTFILREHLNSIWNIASLNLSEIAFMYMSSMLIFTAGVFLHVQAFEYIISKMCYNSNCK